MKKRNLNVDKNGDYILRWKLDPPMKRNPKRDPFSGFVNDLLKELLDVVVLTYKDEDIKVDGFHFLNSPKQHRLYKKK